MKIHLQRELDALKKQLFHLSSLVEEILDDSIRTVTTDSPALVEEIKAKDDVIDSLEVEVEEECLKILALHQPVAVDLRFLVAAMKMNNDLERIGDLAVNIARVQRFLARSRGKHLFADSIEKMGAMARRMLSKALESQMNRDLEGATSILADDAEVDKAYYELIEKVKAEIAKGPDRAEDLIGWIMVAKHLERAADLATNIAEDTIYMVKGDIVRHRNEA